MAVSGHGVDWGTIGMACNGEWHVERRLAANSYFHCTLPEGRAVPLLKRIGGVADHWRGLFALVAELGKTTYT